MLIAQNNMTTSAQRKIPHCVMSVEDGVLTRGRHGAAGAGHVPESVGVAMAHLHKEDRVRLERAGRRRYVCVLWVRVGVIGVSRAARLSEWKTHTHTLTLALLRDTERSHHNRGLN